MIEGKNTSASNSVTPVKKVVRVRPSSVPAVSEATKYRASAFRRKLVRQVVAWLIILGAFGASAAVADHVASVELRSPPACAHHCPAPVVHTK